MSSKLDRALYSLRSFTAQVSEIEIEELAGFIDELGAFLRQNPKDSNLRKGVIKRLANLLKKANKEAREQAGPESISLFKLRSKLLHGVSFDDGQATSYYKHFWKLLETHAEYWRAEELGNLLAYCLHAEVRVDSASFQQPKKIVKIYKAIFDGQTSEDKQRSFRDLLLRVIADPSFRKLIEQEELRGESPISKQKNR